MLIVLVRKLNINWYDLHAKCVAPSSKGVFTCTYIDQEIKRIEKRQFLAIISVSGRRSGPRSSWFMKTNILYQNRMSCFREGMISLFLDIPHIYIYEPTWAYKIHMSLQKWLVFNILIAISGHHTYYEYRQCNKAAWWPTLQRPIEMFQYQRNTLTCKLSFLIGLLHEGLPAPVEHTHS